MDVKYTSLDGDNSATGIADIIVETISKVATKFEQKKKTKADAETAAADAVKEVIDVEIEK
ncbi:MAG: hypothetical protein RSB05_01595 [Clostridiales bacterium]